MSKLFTRTAASAEPLRAWAAGSQLLDPQGMPLKVYHGTTSGPGEDGWFSLGQGGYIYTTTDPAYTQNYNYGRGGKTYPLYAKARKPLDLRSLQEGVTPRGDFQALCQQAGIEVPFGDESALYKPVFQWVKLPGFKEACEAAGYDAIWLRETALDSRADALLLFDPKQLKSAVGNSGAYDPEDARLTASATPKADTALVEKLEDWFNGTHDRAEMLEVFRGLRADYPYSGIAYRVNSKGDIAPGTSWSSDLDLLVEGFLDEGSLSSLRGTGRVLYTAHVNGVNLAALAKALRAKGFTDDCLDAFVSVGEVVPLEPVQVMTTKKAALFIRRAKQGRTTGKASGMQDGERSDTRKLGPCLSQDPRILERKIEYVRLYRAVARGTTTFNDMDYCTLNRSFAEGHADHGAAVDEEPYDVISGVFPVGWIFEAYNPGEYFFHRKDGKPSRGKVIYTAKPEPGQDVTASVEGLPVAAKELQGTSVTASETSTPPGFLHHLSEASDRHELGFYFEEGGCYGMALALFATLKPMDPGCRLLIQKNFAHAYVKAFGKVWDFRGECLRHPCEEFSTPEAFTAHVLETSGWNEEELQGAEQTALEVIETAKRLAGRMAPKTARTLYHGTSTERAKHIQQEGLEPQVGDLVQTAYGDEAGGDYDFEPLAFAGDKDALQRGVYSAMLHAIQADGHDITDPEQAIRNWGALVVLKDGDEVMEHRSAEEDPYGYTDHPLQVETGDYYSQEGVVPDYILQGPTLVRYLKHHGVNLERWTKPFSEKKRNALVGMARRAHPDIPVEKIVERVDALTFEQFQKSWAYYTKLEKGKAAKVASTLEVWHGSPNPEDFTVPDVPYGGAYFSDSATAACYTTGKSGLLVEPRRYRIQVDRVFDARKRGPEVDRVLDTVEQKYGNKADYTDPDDDTYMPLREWVYSGYLFHLGRGVQNDVMEALNSEGYDAVIYPDASPMTGDSTSIVVFDRSKIHPAESPDTSTSPRRAALTASNNEDATGQCHCTVCGTEIAEGMVCTECTKTCRKCGGPTRNCKCASFVHAKDALCHDCWGKTKTATLTKEDIQGRRRALEAFFPVELVQAAIDEAPSKTAQRQVSDPTTPDAQARRESLPKRQPTAAFLAFYRAGERARSLGMSARSGPFWDKVLYDEYVDPEVDLKGLASDEMPVSMAFFEAGNAGNPLPVWVTGWRSGDIPLGGRSQNYRDNRFERGVSMMHVDGLGDTSDGTFALFNSGRRPVEVAGWLITSRGSDGEPLIVGAQPLHPTPEKKASVPTIGFNVNDELKQVLRRYVADSGGQILVTRLAALLTKQVATAVWQPPAYEGYVAKYTPKPLYDKAVKRLMSLKFPLTLYRALKMPSEADLQTEDAGIFWTDRLENARFYTPRGRTAPGEKFVLRTQVMPHMIDWDSTFNANTESHGNTGTREREIKLHRGAPVVVNGILRPGDTEFQDRSIRITAAINEAPGSPAIGFNVNDSEMPWTEMILQGKKTIETRDSDSLRPHVGERVGIVSTGTGPAALVGYCTLGEPKVYRTNEEFRADNDAHQIPGGPQWDLQPGAVKFGYPLSDVEACEPKRVEGQGRVFRRIATEAWRTGTPRTFTFLRNTAKAPKVDWAGQGTEPAGLYVLAADDADDRSLPAGWVRGAASVKNPLVLPWGGGYRTETNWKAVLSQRFGGRTGKALSAAMRKEGIDAVVTFDDYGTQEIVLLDPTTQVQGGASRTSSQRTPQGDAFKTWFKDSKVVDPAGEPLVVIHQTDAEFTTFLRKHLGQNTLGNASDKWYAQTSKVGFWFASQSSTRMHTLPGGRQMRVYLSLQNPWVCPSLDHLAGALEWERMSGEQFRKSLMSKGYDGVIIERDPEVGGTSYIAFRANQIKSVDNAGAFNPKKRDIMASPRSALFRRQAHPTQWSTQAFKAWFAGSKVVNPDGTPKVMYHGTAQPNIAEFDGSSYSDRGAVGFFADDPDFADGFAQEREQEEREKDGDDGPDPRYPHGPQIYPVYIRALNIFDQKNPAMRKQVGYEESGQGNYDYTDSETYVHDIWEAGYDAYLDYEYGINHPPTGLAVRDPHQIKSAVGNAGTFNPADPRITASKTAAFFTEDELRARAREEEERTGKSSAQLLEELYRAQDGDAFPGFRRRATLFTRVATSQQDQALTFIGYLKQHGVRFRANEAGSRTVYVEVTTPAGPRKVRFADHGVPPYKDPRLEAARRNDISIDPTTGKTVKDALDLVFGDLGLPTPQVRN